MDKCLDNEYGYEGDRLLSYGNETCEYDDVGNSATYRRFTLIWEKGDGIQRSEI